VKLQVALFPALSVASTDTNEFPMGNTVPELREATTVGFASQSAVAPISKATETPSSSKLSVTAETTTGVKALQIWLPLTVRTNSAWSQGKKP
jgi:hypothetical protein